MVKGLFVLRRQRSFVFKDNKGLFYLKTTRTTKDNIHCQRKSSCLASDQRSSGPMLSKLSLTNPRGRRRTLGGRRRTLGGRRRNVPRPGTFFRGRLFPKSHAPFPESHALFPKSHALFPESHAPFFAISQNRWWFHRDHPDALINPSPYITVFQPVISPVKGCLEFQNTYSISVTSK